MKLCRHLIKRILTACIILFLGAATCCIAADDSPIAEKNLALSSDEEVSPSPESTVWKEMWGEPTPSAIYLGTVTAHFNLDSLHNDTWNNQLIGADYKGYFAATLLNSYHDRAYIAGIQRYIYTQKISDNFTQSAGYRLGLISGYDERISSLANVSPLLPFPQLIYDLNWMQAGLDFSLSVVAISVGFFYQF